MKKSFLLTAFTILSLSIFAQSEKYISAMKKNISLTDSAFNNPDAFLNLANSFERIGNAEKNQWLPYYYAAYCRINYGFMQKDMSGNDPIADKAIQLINKADSLEPKNSEISVLRSMAATLQMIVNPQQRYMQYGQIISQQLQNAIAEDPSNPRPYLIKGQNLKGTPEQFGGGCKTAKPQLDMALEKYASFKPASDISPNWGRNYTETLAKGCQ